MTEDKDVMMIDPLSETWQIHNRIQLYLLRGLKPEDLAVCLAAKGRTIPGK